MDVLETFGDQDKQLLMENRIKAAVKAGMTTMLNVGYKKDQRLYYPVHNMVIQMPEPGDTFLVPNEVAIYLMKMPSRKKLQIVGRGQQPSNFTPPPGYKLVPIDDLPTIDEIDEETLLVDPEKE